MEEVIRRLKEEGKSRKEIAEIIGWDYSTVKAYCYKHKIYTPGYDPRKPSDKICVKCGASFLGKADKKFCSPECRNQFRLDNKPEVIKRRVFDCPMCGAKVMTNSHAKRFCDECAELRKKTYDRKIPKEKVSTALHVPRKCKWCSEEFITSSAQQFYCSKKCCRNAHRKIGEKRIRKSEEERLKSCADNDKTLWLLPLVKRDNNTCWICGGNCDLYDYSISEKGAFMLGDKYPTIDHIVPISKGGNHIWSNVKLACCSCNRKRGATNNE